MDINHDIKETIEKRKVYLKSAATSFYNQVHPRKEKLEVSSAVVLSLKDENVILSLTSPSDFMFGVLVRSPARLSSNRKLEGEIICKKRF